MDRFLLFCALAALLMLTPAHAAQRRDEETQPVFFSLLFPNLIIAEDAEATPGEAMLL